MNRPVTLAAAVIVAISMAGCGAPSELRVAGNVDANLDAVSMPSLAMPSVNLDAGFATASGPIDPVTGRQGQTISAVAARYGLGSTSTMDQVKVAVGDHVRAGQSLGAVDAAVLAAQLDSAKTDASVAAANVDVLTSAIDDTYSKQHDLADARRKVTDAIRQLESTRNKLRNTRPELRAKLKEVETGLAAIDKAIGSLPPGVPVPPDLAAKRQQLVTAGKQLRAGLKKIDAALPALAKGLKKAHRGLTKLDDAKAKLTDGRATLRDLLDLAKIGADTMRVPVTMASVQLGLAELVSPSSGVVVSIAQPGEQVAPGASAATIRPDGPSTVSVWLSPAQLSAVCLGDSADVHADWLAPDASIPASLTRIGPQADFPPSFSATDEIHLTRAIQVEFTTNEQLPASSPVEVSIHSCRPVATSVTDR